MPKMFMVRISDLGTVCPTQWVGKSNTGDDIYIRYRWGWLEVSVNQEVVHSQQHGDPYDGVMDYQKLKKLVDFIEFPEHTSEEQ